MSKKEMATMGMNNHLAISGDQLELIKNTIAKDATDDELNLFLFDCKRRGVHPLDRMIHFVKRGTGSDAKATHQCSIDYFRSEAEATGEYDGQDEPEFEYADGEQFPSLSRVKIYRKGINRPFIGVARWAEFCPAGKQDFMWRKMPHGQLAKCAEAQGFRKAFPKKFQGIYTDDEMQQADYVDVTPTSKSSTVKPAKKKTVSKEEEGDVRKSLKDLLHKVCAGDEEKMLECLKTVSIFTIEKTEKSPAREHWIKTLALIDTSKIGWIGKAYSALKEMIIKDGLVPKDCTHNPDTCSQSSFEGGLAYCGNKDCPMQANKEF